MIFWKHHLVSLGQPLSSAIGTARMVTMLLIGKEYYSASFLNYA